ncbi:MAG: hypothetical protein ACO1SX_05020 [Actinomycetota bacterium]
MADLEHRSEDADHAPIPARTTPQGTLALTVAHGHEEEDVSIGPLVKWFLVLAGLILFSHVVSFGFYRVLQDTGKPAGDRPLSVFDQRSTPPEPRLLPNRADSIPVANVADSAIQKYEHLEGPGEYAQREIRKDQQALQALGFFDDVSGLPIVPDTAVVQDAQGAAAAPVEERMPSDPTGGGGLENRLR